MASGENHPPDEAKLFIDAIPMEAEEQRDDVIETEHIEHGTDDADES